MSTLTGKVAVVTGAGQGIGREEALLLAREGAAVVVNDIAAPGPDGTRPADAVVAEIEAAGGRAVAHHDDIADWAGGQSLIDAALGLGGLDIVVCNAGIVRDRMVHKMSVEEWDQVVRVNLRGHFVPTRLAAEYWRGKAKSSGAPVDGRLIYTASEAGLYGHIGQANYAAAKAGVAGLCFTVAQELAAFGVTVNVVSPRGRTPMTFGAFGEIPAQEGFDDWAAGNIAPFVAFLAGPRTGRISGQVFVVHGGTVTRLAGWQEMATIEVDHRWELDELLEASQKLAPGLVAEPPVFPVTVSGQEG